MLIIALVFSPTYAAAQEGPPQFELIPKVEWERCGEQACMSFEDAKNLARMRAQYTTLFNLVPTLWAQSQAWEGAAKNSKAAAEFTLSAYDRVFTVYTVQQSTMEQAIRDKNEAEALSVFGDALPYVIVFGAVCFAGGVWLGSK